MLKGLSSIEPTYQAAWSSRPADEAAVRGLAGGERRAHESAEEEAAADHGLGFAMVTGCAPA